jgi:hypothetical protein
VNPPTVRQFFSDRAFCAAQKILLEIFYPDSRGVNVFVGGAKDPDMALKLVRPPGDRDVFPGRANKRGMMTWPLRRWIMLFQHHMHL